VTWFNIRDLETAHKVGQEGQTFDEVLLSIRDAIPMADLNMPVRLYNAMRRHGVKTVGQVRYVLRADGDPMGDHAIDWKNIGWPSVEAGREALERFDAQYLANIRFARDLLEDE
jgi:hypothetical protein